MRKAAGFLLVYFAVIACRGKTDQQPANQPNISVQAAGFPLLNSIYADIDPFLSVSTMSRPEVRILLSQMYKADQQYRDSLQRGNPVNVLFYQRKMVANDQANLKLLHQIIEKYGWPTIGEFGEEGANTAWLIIWHQRGKRDILCRYYDLMERAVGAGEMHKADFQNIRNQIASLPPN